MTTPRATPARFPAEYGQTPETIAKLLAWEEVAERIAASPNYLLATTTDDGRPYLRPVDGVFVDATLRSVARLEPGGYTTSSSGRRRRPASPTTTWRSSSKAVWSW
jgi:hypothetical protein